MLLLIRVNLMFARLNVTNLRISLLVYYVLLVFSFGDVASIQTEEQFNKFRAVLKEFCKLDKVRLQDFSPNFHYYLCNKKHIGYCWMRRPHTLCKMAFNCFFINNNNNIKGRTFLRRDRNNR